MISKYVVDDKLGNSCMSFIFIPWGSSSVAVLPPHCGPLSTGLIPSPSAVCPFGFQSKLATTGFSPGTLVFLLHLELDLFIQKAFLESSACTLRKVTLFKFKDV